MGNHETKTAKEKKASYNLLLEYLVSSPQCVEIFDLINDKDIYFQPEVSNRFEFIKFLYDRSVREISLIYEF